MDQRRQVAKRRRRGGCGDHCERALKKYDNVDGADGMKLFPRPIDCTFSAEYRRYDNQSLTPRLTQCGLSPDEQTLMNAWLSG